MNDIYEAGITDDNFAVLYNCNKSLKIAVRTPPVGITERKIISDVIIKGDVFAPMFCSKHVDTFGHEWLVQNIQGPGSHTSLKYD